MLTKLSNVLYKKFKVSWQSIRDVLDELQKNFYVYTNNNLIIKEATKIAEIHQYSCYDSLIITSALTYNCQYLFTEDLHYSHNIQNKLEIVNPFKQ